MNEQSVGPDLKVFKSSRSCNSKNIQKMNRISNITTALHLLGTSSQNKAKLLLATKMLNLELGIVHCIIF